jgi:hypothetical protein
MFVMRQALAKELDKGVSEPGSGVNRQVKLL